MGQFPKCDFYCDLEKLEALESVYRAAADELAVLYFEFEAIVGENGNREFWSGKTYESFAKEFENWKQDYMRLLSSLVLLDNGLVNTYGIVNQLIEMRNSLESSIDSL